MTSKRAWSIIFNSLILISFGENLSCNFLLTSCVIFCEDSGTLSRCSFGIIRECPLLNGFNSRIAI